MNDLARVARATNQAEAEFVQSLLRDAGIPSMLRRSPGIDGEIQPSRSGKAHSAPDFL